MTVVLATDTIFALSSGRPPAAIAVVRVSGPRAGAALERLIGRVPTPRHATLATVRDPSSQEPIDQAVVLWFPAPHSETGEDTAELQLHGGRAVIAATMAALGRLEGLRSAEPGEFTRRAFANGRIDLTAVEGLADLIGAETEAQRRQALHQLRGALRARVEGWRSKLIGALALLEAGLDFSDEGDVPEKLTGPALQLAEELRQEIHTALADAERGERLREGFVIAIAGPPNAGKSSIFNWLAQRDAAIVSPYPGTTRDVLELHLDLGGFPVTILDTAGVRPSDDPVEQEGIRRAEARAADADLVLWVEEAIPHRMNQNSLHADHQRLHVLNKADLLTEGCEQTGQLFAGRAFAVSARTGEGLPALLTAIQEKVAAELGGGEPALVTRARHREMLEQAAVGLGRAITEAGQGEELVAEELRLVARALGRLVGRIDVEDVLDVIFRDFCIGK